MFIVKSNVDAVLVDLNTAYLGIKVIWLGFDCIRTFCNITFWTFEWLKLGLGK